MSYTPTVWQNGDLITPEALNHLEQGVANEQVGPQGPAGPAGPAGADGATGPAGADGADGFSPTVTVTDITGGHRVTITDASGPHAFDVMDGQDGSGGGTEGVTSFNGRSGAVTPQSGDYSVSQVTGAAPTASPVFTESISLGRRGTTGGNSFAAGSSVTANGAFSHAEGFSTTASGEGSHAEGSRSLASGGYSHAEGIYSRSMQEAAHAEGFETKASGYYSHAGGYYTEAKNKAETAIGSYNVLSTGSNSTLSNLFVVGKGDEFSARANAFRVSTTGCYGTGAWNASGADYAELFEWADGNPDAEDRAGRFVTLSGEKIRIATPEDDFILGIISGNPSVVGDVHDDQWQGMYLYDVFGRPLWEDVEVPDEIIEEPDPEDPEKMVTRVLVPAHTEHRQKINPDYDGTKPYQARTKRPEWDAVGMMGKLVAVDDGTCYPDGWCAVGDGGIATQSAERTRYRVMARLDGSHVKVLVI